jgi:hypothetical protein
MVIQREQSHYYIVVSPSVGGYELQEKFEGHNTTLTLRERFFSFTPLLKFHMSGGNSPTPTATVSFSVVVYDAILCPLSANSHVLR